MTKALHLLAIGVAIAAMPVLAAAEAGAQQRLVGSSGPITPLSHGGHFRAGLITPLSHGGHFRSGHFRRGHVRRGHHGGHFKRGHVTNFILVEREVPVIVEREVVREVVREVAPPAPPPPRKPYVVGRSYASLPGGCMKMIEGGASYYYCGGGEWYRLVGSGAGAVKYRAIAKP